jgi:type III secretion system (T3SS) SseB-like protein
MTGPPASPGGAPEWLPGNEVDAELVSALAADDRRRFARTVRQARWYLPVLSGEHGRSYLTRDLLGATYLLVFTSPRSLAATVGGVATGCVITGYDELATRWPDPSWRLAVNPGTPVDLWVTCEMLAAAAAGERLLPSLAPTRDPAVDGPIDEFLGRLVRAPLLVPSNQPREPRVEVFTSTTALAQRYPHGTATVVRTVPELLVDWPAGHALAIDPGSPATLVIPADQVPALLLWGPQRTPGPATGTN